MIDNTFMNFFKYFQVHYGNNPFQKSVFNRYYPFDYIFQVMFWEVDGGGENNRPK